MSAALNGSVHVPRETFPESHPVEMLRGEKRMNAHRVRRALVSRCEWLQMKLRERVALGLNTDRYRQELAALVQAAEAFDRHVEAGGRP